ncbi:Xaa-Pro aminopeptidase [Bradyrhizobium sp. USDA 4532]|uniref:M24 family metallopeptidase n=1 Tax=unclassified Bradyrhizobium TaxID=2631580 RepID=UPI0020A10691|nr:MULTISPECIES: Xaa-Pro peptidase family protein [unclassified Bradyrhizobium]MCP1835581.1 Xaa-Pro aminopeptidase [Bradyrhizobium sp. USDA 4545]MCP1920330.1 Xaa-Pro aminopeptidase [Bradyrhizobium sp. USDA 4532]
MAIAKARQAFPRTEYLRRLAAVKSDMARRDIDALVITSWGNITYLTGNVTRMLAVHALVVSIKDEEPTLIVRKMCAPGAAHQSFMAREKIVGYSENLVGKANSDGYDAVIDFLYDIGVAQRGIGLEQGNLMAPAVEKFKTRLPQARVVDCTRAVDWIRGVKSDLEIAVMREAAALADAAVMRAKEVIRPGVREADAAVEIMAAQVNGVKGGPAATGLRPPLISSTPRTGTPHILWSENVFREGMQINSEVSGNRYNYLAALMRTFSIGAPTDRVRRLHDAQVAAIETALDLIRPGRTCSEVAHAMYRAIEKHGFPKESRCGYSIGIENQFTAWIEPTASFAREDMTELKTNMTFHLMLGNWVEEEFGVTVSETIRVADTGVETLTRAPRELFVL